MFDWALRTSLSIHCSWSFSPEYNTNLLNILNNRIISYPRYNMNLKSNYSYHFQYQFTVFLRNSRIAH